MTRCHSFFRKPITSRRSRLPTHSLTLVDPTEIDNPPWAKAAATQPEDSLCNNKLIVSIQYPLPTNRTSRISSL